MSEISVQSAGSEEYGYRCNCYLSNGECSIYRKRCPSLGQDQHCRTLESNRKAVEVIVQRFLDGIEGSI